MAWCILVQKPVWVQKTTRLFLIFILLNTVIGPGVFAQSNPSPPPDNNSDLELTQFVTGKPAQVAPPPIPMNEQQSGLLELTLPPQDQGPTQRTGFTCSTTQMDPKERQRFWDETLKKGFVGKNFNSGAPVKPNRNSLDQNVLIIPDEKGKLALKQQIPNQKIDPEEIAHLLNKYHRGAYAFGILLPDTLRAGRCKDLNSGCALLGKKLTLRNSGKGIIENYKNVWNDLWNWVKPDDANSTVPGIPKQDLDTIKAELITTYDVKQMPLKTATRVSGKIIPNSILTDSFSSTLNSNCTSAACRINTYSMFDKMFNAYSSGGMLLTTFGPSFINQAKRLFGWTNLRLLGPHAPGYSAFGKRLRSLYMKPDSWYTNWVSNRRYQLIKSKVLDFDPILMGQKKLLEGGSFDAWWNPIFKKELAPITDPVKRGDYYRYIQQMKQFADSQELGRTLAEEKFLTLAKGLDPLDPRYLQAKREFAASTGKIWRDVDDFTGTDIPEWHLNHKSVNWQKYAVKTHTGDFVQPSVDSDFYDIMLKKLEKDGAQTGRFDFTSKDLADYREIFDTKNGKLLLYSVEPTGQKVTSITRDTLEDALAKGNFANMYAQLGDESFVPLTKNNMEFILKRSTGDIPVFRGGYKAAREVSPDELSDLVLGDRGYKPIRSMSKNLGTILSVLRENGWQFRQHWGSLLDRYFAQNQQIIKTYLSVKGGAKLTAYPFAFWGFKRGFGQEALSLYQLPDSWTSLEMYNNPGELFNNSFIDFFANEGSDEGDVFVAFLNKLPWKMVLDKVSEQYAPLNEIYQSITKNEIRDETGSLAVFTSGPQTCEQCTLSIQTKDNKTFSPFFSSPQNLETFILEDTPPAQKEVGQTLIAYAYRTNLRGTSRDIDTKSGGIDLEDAIRNKETCQEKVKKMNANIPIVGWWFPKILPESARSGGILVFGETLGYALFTWAGFLGTAYQQIILAPELQDCVDTQEGYFVHFFAPKVKEKKEVNKQTVENLNTTKVAEAIQEGSDRFFSALQGDPESWTGKAAEQTKQKVKALVQNAETKDLVEAVLKTNGATTGQMSGSHLFYLWLQGDSDLTPSSYRTTGKEEISDDNTTITNDFEKGQVKVNGVPVITDPDITRLASLNSAGPFEEYPNTITKIGLPTNLRNLIFTMNAQSHTMVMDPDVLECIKQGALEQTGVGLQSDDLAEVFGATDAVITDTHPNIYAQPEMERIVAEGVPRKIAQGRDSHVDIFSNAETELVKALDSDNNVGRLKSIQFRNGVIMYKPSTHELLVWLKRNEKTILNQNEVTGLKATPTTSVNPLTNCQEPAIDLQVAGDPTSEQAVLKAKQFNDSLKHMGPFKIFDTPSKRFIFYSGPPPECQPRFKIIDKKTGEVLVDQPIKSIEATPDGVRVTTEDGKTHDLGFKVEGGKPILTYNGQPEPLLSAQGDKGAFWYDPNKGLWYTENAQLLPLLEAFKSKGLSTQVGPDGKVNTTATGNVLNLSVGSGKDTGFNLPSLPENPLLLALFILGLVGVLMVLHQRKTK